MSNELDKFGGHVTQPELDDWHDWTAEQAADRAAATTGAADQINAAAAAERAHAEVRRLPSGAITQGWWINLDEGGWYGLTASDAGLKLTCLACIPGETWIRPIGGHDNPNLPKTFQLGELLRAIAEHRNYNTHGGSST